jgi:plastocyanin
MRIAEGEHSTLDEGWTFRDRHAMKLQCADFLRCCLILSASLFALPSFAATHTVDVLQNSFSPATLEISVGDTVRWVNRFDEFHTTTSSAPIPLWRGLLLDEEDEFPHTFNSPGTFPYHCEFHAGMTGTIVVTSGNAAPTVTLLSPANDAKFFAPASFTLEAEAADSDGTVAQVQFFANLSPIGTATNSVNGRYSITVNELDAGDYVLSAQATDNLGATGSSAPVTIRITPAPEIRLGNVERLPDGSFRFFVLGGEAGQTAVIQASPDLTDWTSVATNVFPATVCPICPYVEFTDASAPTTTQRFFRASVSP